MPTTVTDAILDSLEKAGVRYVFGIPGAKIDAIFDGLLNHPRIKLIVCRHEQNAAFIAAAIGRLTGVPGVAITTSGPGASNLTTGLATATTEGYPIVALVGSVPRADSHSHTHQSMQTSQILGGATKSAMNLDAPEETCATVIAAFRMASADPKGATVISIPADVAKLSTDLAPFASSAFRGPALGAAPQQGIEDAVTSVRAASCPVILLGQRCADAGPVMAIRHFLERFPIPVIETFQAAGALSQVLARQLYFGRVGLFRNQVGDRLLSHADLVICVGYDPTEYTPDVWNASGKLRIIQIDSIPCAYNAWYNPQLELVGSIPQTINAMSDRLHENRTLDTTCQALLEELNNEILSPQPKISPNLVHPLHFVTLLQSLLDKDTTVCVDVGTVYIYMMRHFRSYEPLKLLCSDGQQTLGVALPTAIAASLVQDPPCSQKVVSVSGDGGFMFSSQEMTTAVQQGCNITHFIWNSYSYNMVEFQEDIKYGRSSGIALGAVDFVKVAEGMGAKGFKVKASAELESVMKAALAYQGVALVEFDVDYSGSRELAEHLVKDAVQ